MVHVMRPGDAYRAVAADVAHERGGRVAARGHVVRGQLEPCWLWKTRENAIIQCEYLP